MDFNGLSGYLDKVLAFKDSNRRTNHRPQFLLLSYQNSFDQTVFQAFFHLSNKNNDANNWIIKESWCLQFIASIAMKSSVILLCVLMKSKATIYILFSNCFCWYLFCAPSIVNWAKINQLKNCFPFSQFWNNAIRSTCGKIYRWPSFCFDGFVVSDIKFLCWGHKISKGQDFKFPNKSHLVKSENSFFFFVRRNSCFMIENINNSLIHRFWCEYKVETTESDADDGWWWCYWCGVG